MRGTEGSRFREGVGHVSPEFLRAVRATFEPVKRLTYDRMSLEAGHRVLDIGCGPGTDTVALAELVGPDGEAVGIDVDEEMIARADARASAADTLLRPTHVCAEAGAIPYGDDYFHACRAERVFQHLVDPRRALREACRVTRVGGAVVVADPDFCSLSIDTSSVDVERRIVRSIPAIQANGYSARHLYREFRETGLERVVAEVVPLVLHTYDVLGLLLQAHRAELLEAAGVTDDEFAAFEGEIQHAVTRGVFFASMGMIVAVGHVASPA